MPAGSFQYGVTDTNTLTYHFGRADGSPLQSFNALTDIQIGLSMGAWQPPSNQLNPAWYRSTELSSLFLAYPTNAYPGATQSSFSVQPFMAPAHQACVMFLVGLQTINFTSAGFDFAGQVGIAANTGIILNNGFPFIRPISSELFIVISNTAAQLQRTPGATTFVARDKFVSGTPTCTSMS